MMAPRSKSRRGADSGTAAVEFSIIAPILVLLMAATFEIGRALQTVSAVNKLASQYANAWADCTDEPVGTCNTELSQYTSLYSIANLAPYLSTTTTPPTTGVTLQMFQVTMNGTTPVIKWPGFAYSSPNPAPSTSLNAAQISAAQNVLSSGQSGVIVTVSYTFQPAIFTHLLPGFVSPTVMTYTAVQLKA